MKRKQPLVSILLEVHNAQDFLKESIKSLLSQTFTDIEIIAIDDYSKDNSYKILKKFNSKYKNFHISRNKKRYGMAVCLNRALKKAHGNFITFMDASDISTSDRVKRQLQYLLSNPKTVAVGTQTVFIDKNNKKIAKSTFPSENEIITKSLISGLSMQFETVMINKTMLPKDLLSFKNNKYPFIFSELLVKLLPYGEVANLPWLLYYHRRIPEAASKLPKQLPLLLKHLAKSIALDNYRPSFYQLLTGDKPITSFSR